MGDTSRVDRCAIPAASIAGFSAGLTGGNGASVERTAAPESTLEGVGVAICVETGGSETVGTGPGSRDCDAIG